MHQTQLILQIIASCDEALRDAFLRRMDAAVLIAKNKLEQGDAIYNPAQEEAVLRQITYDLAPDLRLRADAGFQIQLQTQLIPDLNIPGGDHIKNRIAGNAVFCVGVAQIQKIGQLVVV